VFRFELMLLNTAAITGPRMRRAALDEVLTGLVRPQGFERCEHGFPPDMVAVECADSDRVS
jgi:hypothetical protein